MEFLDHSLISFHSLLPQTDSREFLDTTGTPGIEQRLQHAFKVLVLTVFTTPPRRHLLLSKTSYLVHNFFTTRCQTVLELRNPRRTLWVTDLLFACSLRSSQLVCSPLLAFIRTTLEWLMAWRRAAML
jgi:hypothetical protein